MRLMDGRIDPMRFYDDGSIYAALELTPATMSRARRAGEIRFFRKGIRILYRGQWVLDWLEQQSTMVKPE